MAKAIYQQAGNTLDYKNSGSAAIEAGTVVSLTTRVGVAAADIPVGAVGALAMEGVFKFLKASSLEIAAGDAVYYNTSDNVVDKTTSGVPAGYAVAAASASDTLVAVKLLG